MTDDEEQAQIVMEALAGISRCTRCNNQVELTHPWPLQMGPFICADCWWGDRLNKVYWPGSKGKRDD